MNETYKQEDVLGYECRFAVYCPPPQGENTDMHTVKEIVHLKDGRRIPHLRMLRNYKRPFWVTKKGLRTHNDKKEWEKIDRVLKHETTQTNLVQSVSRALGEPWFRGDQRMLGRSPYVYGTDILSTAVIKRSYQDRYPELNTPYSVAPFDVETDVVRGTNQIIMATLSFKNRVFTAIQRSFLEGQADVIPRLQEKLRKYLGAMEIQKKDGSIEVVDFLKKRQIEWEPVIVDSEIDVVKAVFQKAHEWQPDFVAVWNIDFDMSKVLKACERANADPAQIFSDPRVPPEYRYFRYKRGSKQKVTASGKQTPKRPEEQWHTVYCPASFYFVDAMCAYNFVRAGSAKETAYSLDFMLQKHLGARKLKFSEADGLSSIDYHVFMQDRFPLEYVIYNVFDCVSMEELDEKTNDLNTSMPLLSGCSDFENFKSQPRRLADSLHYFALSHELVMGCTSDEMSGAFDKETISIDGWIVTLPAHLVLDNGLRCILENQFQATNIRAHVADLDVSASYPNGEAVFNISKETTHKELIEIEGVTEYQRRMQGINLSAGHTNAVEFCTNLFGLPQLNVLLEEFEREQNQPKLQESF
jgi:hypothetical protein